MSHAQKPRLVVSPIDIPSWLARLPTVDEVRPKSCPACGRANHVPGRPFAMQGHGIRSRQVRGPIEPDGPPVVLTIPARRYLCRCGATCLVVPTGVLAHRRYSAAAITSAFALYGLSKRSLAYVRLDITGRKPFNEDMPASSDGRSSITDGILTSSTDCSPITNDWPTLRRWCTAVRTGSLFECVRPPPPSASNRFIAERAATTLAASGPAWLRSWPMSQRAVLAASMYDDGNACIHRGLRAPTNSERSAASTRNPVCTVRDQPTREGVDPYRLEPTASRPRIETSLAQPSSTVRAWHHASTISTRQPSLMPSSIRRSAYAQRPPPRSPEAVTMP